MIRILNFLRPHIHLKAKQKNQFWFHNTYNVKIKYNFNLESLLSLVNPMKNFNIKIIKLFKL